MASPLSDLDELVLKCRDQRAKDYIKEAVACYKAGAFRSAIVSTWIAVSFDIIDKLKELSLAGDKEAEKQIDIFDNARRIGDIANSLKFERDILTICLDKLELISPIEFIDLTRLHEDRNRCAHPSMTTDSDVFNPSAELARMHIKSAVEHLLQYPPAQGKYALDSLIAEVDSEYFPTDIQKAVVAFEKSPLKKARNSLIRNFTIILLKKYINEANDFKKIARIHTALNAIGNIHREVYSETLREKLSNIIRAMNKEQLHIAILLATTVNDCWAYFDLDIKQKLETYVENLPKDKFNKIDMILSIDDLVTAVKKRLHKATRQEFDEPLFFFTVPTQITDRIVQLYISSNSIKQADSFVLTVIWYAREYTREQIQKIIIDCSNNFEIIRSQNFGTVIEYLRENNNVSNDEIDKWLSDANLNKFIKVKSEELNSNVEAN
ncbi:hypothetical protein [Entomomonas asaccharolytica]|uniref:Uncharacterized protein n=1 Tax=Entomomonas asaccharolytica TaxID=2785331 RepID=A0A974RX12_9GAMM|nr:hypothetical protein [Entomomonas asaccharolytica]QQP85717.1 hypothetical protein JHT90_00170 [Entomomonas asaccharolytica]